MKTKQNNLLGMGSQQITTKVPSSIQGILVFLWLPNPHSFIVKKILHYKKNYPNMWMHKVECLINQLWIWDLMKFKLLNIHSSSIENNTWIMVISINFTYSKMLWNKMVDLMMILHILVKRLIIWRGPRVALALLFMVILNMDFCTFKVDTQNTLVTMTSTTPILFGVQNRCLTIFKYALNDSS